MRHGEVDLDRLADYAAGALDRAAAEEVSHLIATRPAWSDAYLALVAADATTRAQLRDYARSHVERMPADVIARLDEALRRPVVDPVARAADHPHVVSLEEARRRRRRFNRLASAAAAVVVIGGGAVLAGVLGAVNSPGPSGDARGSSEYAQPDSAGGVAGPAASQPPAAAAAALVVASGTDYRTDTLAQVLNLTARVPQSLSAGPPALSKDGSASGKFSERLSGLAGGASLQACLGAITRTQPGSIAVVDFAQYQGEPALVVLVRDSVPGSGVVVVVGPECGATNADVRAVQRVP